jgi:chlorite dismutase
VARRFTGIETNTSYSFGLDDQEFVVAFDADDPAEFLDLVQELRGTESSAYTESETPIFTCISASIERALDALDGERAARASTRSPGEVVRAPA